MESVAAFGLAANILQFAHFSLGLFSRSRQIYRSAQGAIPEAIDTELIANDVVTRVGALRAQASLTAHSSDVSDNGLFRIYDSCLEIAEDIVSTLNRIKVNGKKTKWKSFKAALKSVKNQEQVDELRGRLENLKQEIQLSGIVSINGQIVQHTQKLDSMDAQLKKMCNDVTTLLSHCSGRLKDLGFPWESGTPEHHVRIDDGQGTEYFLPLDVCSTPWLFFRMLDFKFTAGHLPSLRYKKDENIELWDWSEGTMIGMQNWSSMVEGGKGIKVSFVKRQWKGSPHGLRPDAFEDILEKGPWWVCNPRFVGSPNSLCGVESDLVIPAFLSLRLTSMQTWIHREAAGLDSQPGINSRDDIDTRDEKQGSSRVRLQEVFVG